jgi:hypothetical protein
MIKNIELTISQLQLFSNFTNITNISNNNNNIKLKENFLLFPCCWTPEKSKSLMQTIALQVHWRFCGSFFIGDKTSIKNMHTLMLKEFSKGLTELEAFVKCENISSQKVFEKLGWEKQIYYKLKKQ